MANSFQAEGCSNEVSVDSAWVLKCLIAILFSNLWRLVDGLDVDSYTIWEVRVGGIVSIEPGCPLLVEACLLPGPNELRNLFGILEGAVIDMSETLSHQHYSWRQTFITHAQRERLVIQTVIFDFVTKHLHGCTVLASLRWQMLTGALLFHFNEIVLKTYMFRIDVDIVA